MTPNGLQSTSLQLYTHAPNGTTMSCSIPRRVAHEGQAFVIGRPTGDVDCALAAVEVGDDFRLAAGEGHEAQVDVLVKRVLVCRHVGLK